MLNFMYGVAGILYFYLYRICICVTVVSLLNLIFFLVLLYLTHIRTHFLDIATLQFSLVLFIIMGMEQLHCQSFAYKIGH